MPKTNGKQTPKQALQEWLKKRDLTISDFADRLNYTYGYAWQLVRGDRAVSFELLGRMMVVFGCDHLDVIIEAMRRESLTEQSA